MNEARAKQNGQSGPKVMSDEQVVAVRERCNALVDQGVVTRATIYRQSGISQARLSQFLRGVYSGRNDVVAGKLQLWLDTHDRRQEAEGHLLAGPGFVVTPTASKIMDAVSYAHHASDVVLIHGGAGTGKTRTLREYRDQHAGVCLSTMTPAHTTVATALREIGVCYGVRQKRDTAHMWETLVQVLQDRRGLLLVDEAQHLSYRALDAIRQIHDAAGCGLVLAGNDSVFTGLTNTRSAEYLDRLASRIGMRLSVKNATVLDAAAMLDAWKIKDKEVRDLLQSVARKPGGLRLVDKVIRCAHMYADDRAVEKAPDLKADDIRHAWELLGGEQ